MGPMGCGIGKALMEKQKRERKLGVFISLFRAFIG